jgi:hypothetical protein
MWQKVRKYTFFSVRGNLKERDNFEKKKLRVDERIILKIYIPNMTQVRGLYTPKSV